MTRPVSPPRSPGGAGRGPAALPGYAPQPRSRQQGRAEPQIHARDLGRKGPLTPFAHLARTQLWSVAGDALITIGLSTSVFFNGDPNAPRAKVGLYLFLTLAPFAVASPLIGPTLDRLVGGRRWMIFGAALSRAFFAFLLIRDLDSGWFYLWAFMMLVLSKVHLISKSAVLPTTVRSDRELVEANSKLSLLGALAGVVAGGPGLLLAKVLGPQWSLGLALGAFLLTAYQSYHLPDIKVAAQPVGEEERTELQGAGIIRAAEAMSALRFVVGFLTFAILFDFRSFEAVVDGEIVHGRPNLWYGVAAISAQAGYLLGSGLAPVFRRKLTEEYLVLVGVAFSCVMAGIASMTSGLGGAALLAFAVGSTASLAKQGFDSLVQRDAPDANRGRSFAKFESRFQLVWVLGAAIPVIVPIPQRAAFVTITLVCLFAGVSYTFGYRQIRAAAAGLRPPIPPRLPLYQRLYYVVRPEARPVERTSGPPTGPHEVDPYITGFLIDPLHPLDPLDPTAVAPVGEADPAVGAAGAGGVAGADLAPSNPLVGGRWRSPEPEELFAPEEERLPLPPPEVTPTGIFAPSVPVPPAPPAAPEPEPVRDPTIPWFEDPTPTPTPVPSPPAVGPSTPAPGPAPAPMAGPVAVPAPAPSPAGVEEVPLPGFETLVAAPPPAPVDEPDDGWDIQEPRWRDARSQPRGDGDRQ